MLRMMSDSWALLKFSIFIHIYKLMFQSMIPLIFFSKSWSKSYFDYGLYSWIPSYEMIKSLWQSEHQNFEYWGTG